MVLHDGRNDLSIDDYWIGAGRMRQATFAECWDGRMDLSVIETTVLETDEMLRVFVPLPFRALDPPPACSLR